MKKMCLFFVLFVFLQVELNAQSAYIPMLVADNQWNELAENLSLPPQYQYEHTYITKLGGDTIIDGKAYYKLLKTTGAFIPSPSSISPEYKYNWETNGCIREDVENQKVYYKPDYRPEFLLYDFDVKEGDEILSHDSGTPDITVSMQVDTVKQVLIDNKWRKQICLRSTATNINCICITEHKWIEGIGCLEGFLNSTQAKNNPGSERISLLCFSQNGNLVYTQKPSGTDIEDCYVWRYKPLLPNAGQIDSVSLKTVTTEHAEYVVYSSLLGGYDSYTVEYQENVIGEMEAKILYSQHSPSDDYILSQTAINIPKFGFLRAGVEIWIRYKSGGTEEEPEYTDSRQVDKAEISLVSLNVYNTVVSDGITVSSNELKMENGEWRINSVVINDLSGKKVADYKFSILNSLFSIDISALPAGIYFVNIQTDKGLTVKKFVKE
jgi:hypothetical protein